MLAKKEFGSCASNGTCSCFISGKNAIERGQKLNWILYPSSIVRRTHWEIFGRSLHTAKYWDRGIIFLTLTWTEGVTSNSSSNTLDNWGALAASALPLSSSEPESSSGLEEIVRRAPNTHSGLYTHMCKQTASWRQSWWHIFRAFIYGLHDIL